MPIDRTFARVVRRAAIANLLMVACCAQEPAQTKSAVPALPSGIPSTAAHYSVLTMGNLAGQQAMWTAPDGSLHIFFQFNDRGRGPQITSVIKLDAKGVPVSETVTGHDYLKSPVHESYTQESGVAHWKSESETGEKNVTGPAMYWALNGTPAEIALLAQVALDNGGSAGLLPEGEATIKRLTGLELTASGQKKQVTL